MHSAMEQTRYWMWTRNLAERASILGSQIQTAVSATSSYSYETWEERAFAKDSAGHLGGCIWPPRSYSCSFCGREFRSAQALGGHMNVHRRDRARLKQSLSPTGDDSDHDSPHNSNPKPKPASNPLASPLSPRVSVASNPEVSKHALFSPSYPSSLVQNNKVDSCFATTRSFMDLVPAGEICIPELKLGSENFSIRDPSKDDEENISIKRQRTDSKFSIFMRSSSAVQQTLPAELLKLSPCPVEELDLELRLGQKRKPVMVE